MKRIIKGYQPTDEIDTNNLPKISAMKANKPFDPETVCRVKIEKGEKDGRHHQNIYMPDGQKIPKVIWTRVYDHYDEIPYVIAKIYINISEE